MKRVTIHTDGACSGNPGPGGWAAILQYEGTTKEIFGGEPATTNNRMEMRAAIAALECLNQRCTVSLYTDSLYVRDGITKWIHSWKATAWRKPVKNKELWLHLDEVASRHQVTWHWLRGHAGHPENERCDALATAESARQREAAAIAASRSAA